ncbi:SAF domain-containing protein [Embleya sp. NPDC055664]
MICTLVFALVAQKLGKKHEALALSRAVPAGHQLSADDLRPVSVAADGGVGLVSVNEKASIVGRIALGALPAGTLIQRDLLGSADAYPPPGHAVLALPVKQGGLPALRPGQRVAILDGGTRQPGNTGGPGDADRSIPVVATVIAVDAMSDNGPGAVVSLLMETAAAQAVSRVGDPRLAILPLASNEVP